MKKELQVLYKKYGKDFIKILTNELIVNKKKSSGKLIKSLKADVKPIGENVNIVINSEKYLEYIDKGRAKGKFPPIAPIAKWCTIKGLPKSAAFAIAQNIYKFGIKPTNVISKALKKFTDTETKKIEKDVAPLVEKEVVMLITKNQK